jgi:hypothetical protein
MKIATEIMKLTTEIMKLTIIFLQSFLITRLMMKEEYILGTISLMILIPCLFWSLSKGE